MFLQDVATLASTFAAHTNDKEKQHLNLPPDMLAEYGAAAQYKV